MLYDGGGQGGAQQDYFYQASGTVPKSKQCWEEFKKDLAKRVRVQRVGGPPTVPQNKEGDEAEDVDTCTVCTDKLKDRCVLKSTPRPTFFYFYFYFYFYVNIFNVFSRYVADALLLCPTGLCRCENFPCEGTFAPLVSATESVSW
jgi:hypothetical protein